MKSIRSICFLTVATACLGGAALGAQEAGPDGASRHGGFGGPVVKLTGIDDRLGVLVGGHGGWIIDGAWVIGGGGYALANVSNFDDLTNGGESGGLELAYGGVEFRYVHRPEALMHMSLGLLVGAGGLAWTPDASTSDEIDDGFFVAEPEVAVVVNATRFMRAALGVSYRLTGGVDLVGLGNAELSGVAAVLAFNFGGFH